MKTKEKKKKYRFKVLRGNHVNKDTGEIYKRGETVRSEDPNLHKAFVNHFKPLDQDTEEDELEDIEDESDEDEDYEEGEIKEKKSKKNKKGKKSKKSKGDDDDE